MKETRSRRWDKGMLRISIFYGCLSAAVLLGTVFSQALALPALSMAFARMFPYLFLGGGGVFLFLSRYLPGARISEHYRIFQYLYHSGLLVLAAASFWNGINAGLKGTSSDIRLAVIAGGTLLCAGAIILALIVWEQMKK